jgi:hypothetical protein
MTLNGLALQAVGYPAKKKPLQSEGLLPKKMVIAFFLYFFFRSNGNKDGRGK